MSALAHHCLALLKKFFETTTNILFATNATVHTYINIFSIVIEIHIHIYYALIKFDLINIDSLDFACTGVCNTTYVFIKTRKNYTKYFYMLNTTVLNNGAPMSIFAHQPFP